MMTRGLHTAASVHIAIVFCQNFSYIAFNGQKTVAETQLVMINELLSTQLGCFYNRGPKSVFQTVQKVQTSEVGS